MTADQSMRYAFIAAGIAICAYLVQMGAWIYMWVTA